MAIFWTIITLDPFLTMAEAMKPDESLIALLTAIAMISFLPLIPLSVAPAKAVSRRLIFLAIGLLLLIGLNELSKLAPKLHEWGL